MTMHTNATPTDASGTDSESSDAEPGERTESKLPEQAKPLAAYLDRRLSEEGTFYDKSRFIAEELSLSAKEIGSYMPRLQEQAPNLQIEKWSYTNGTTWRVSRP